MQLEVIASHPIARRGLILHAWEPPESFSPIQLPLPAQPITYKLQHICSDFSKLCSCFQTSSLAPKFAANPGKHTPAAIARSSSSTSPFWALQPWVIPSPLVSFWGFFHNTTSFLSSAPRAVSTSLQTARNKQAQNNNLVGANVLFILLLPGDHTESLSWE